MRLDKIKNTFNDYKMELSFGQLEVIAAALEQDHSDPVSDELHAELQWYMQRVPGPGEEEEDIKAREEAAAGAPTGDVEGEDVPVPVPPTEGSADQGEAPPRPEEIEAGGEGMPGEEAPPTGEETEPGEPDAAAVKNALAGGGPVPEPGYTDQEPKNGEEERLPAPPNE